MGYQADQSSKRMVHAVKHGVKWIAHCCGLMEQPIAFILIFLAPLQGISASFPPIHDEQRLYERIMGNYVRSVKPVVKGDLPLQVLFSIRLKQIVDLDERQQVLTTNVFIDQTWVDSALAWNASEFSDVTSLRIPADLIWKPDTFIYNNADNGSTGFISGKFIQIHHNGAVTWPVPFRLRSSCVVKIAYFPFDYQRCRVRFGSWIYSHEFVDYTIRPMAVSVDLATYINNSEWELLSMTMEKATGKRSRSSNMHPFLTMTLYLRRNTFFYLFNIIVPCTMLSMLTLMTFWLPPTSGEKVTLGLSVFLAFSMFMLLIADEVPASSDAVPIIGIYLCVVMTLTSLSVILAVLVTNLYHRGAKLRPAPRWFARLFIEILAIPMGVSRDVQLLATTIILPDHCRFFLIHNKFDFPNYNVNYYNKYSRAQQDTRKSGQSPEKNHIRKSRIEPAVEDQRFVFDHHESPNRYQGSCKYTSGKRKHAHQGDKVGQTPQRKLIRKSGAEYTNVSCVSDECLDEMCNTETELDGNESSSRNHRSHCNLQHVCDSKTPSRKSGSPLMNKIFNSKQSKRQSNRDDTSKNSILSSPESSRGGKYDTSDGLSFLQEDDNIQIVTVDMSPAGTTVDKSFPFMEQSPLSSFGIDSTKLTSPSKRRRQLIKTVRDYNESRENSLSPSKFPPLKNGRTISPVRIDSVSQSDSSRCHKSMSKRHKILPSGTTDNCVLGGSGVNLGGIRLREIVSENHQASVNSISRNRLSSNSSSIYTPSNIDTALTTQSASDQFSQTSAHTRHIQESSSDSSSCFSYDNLGLKTPPTPTSFHESPTENLCETTSKNSVVQQTLRSNSARLQPISGTDNLMFTDETFCQCADSLDDVWVPYDASENSRAVDMGYWEEGVDLHTRRPTVTFPFNINNPQEYGTATPLLTHNAGNSSDVYLNGHLSGVRAKQKNSLKQQYAERFMDERSRLILSKSRLVMAEWQTIAYVIDRLLFLIALFATIFGYVFLLAVVPHEHSLDSVNISRLLPASTGKYDWNAE